MGFSGLTHAGRLVYVTPDLTIPFWRILARGIELEAQANQHDLRVLDSHNSVKQELEHVISALNGKVDGLIISPTNSSAAVTLLSLAQKASVPVVIADVGTESGEYVSYIKSNNYQGAYNLGIALLDKLKQQPGNPGRVGVIAIPQTRANGRERTAGFIRAIQLGGVRMAGIRQQRDFTAAETYRFTRELISDNPDLCAIWLQGSDKYKAAQRAIAESGRPDILLLSFDAEPEFLDMIDSGDLLASSMQQPLLLGQAAVREMHKYLRGEAVSEVVEIPVLTVTAENLKTLRSTIVHYTLGIED
ncbi:substrate-binding domain-containing protein [Neptuniibacter sp. CAU 1671]|uniref:substrate-binding domain-containing protein n=1 Tax=Neptuniibacter sp. CAU 1671 TaxID=3032593 RepID=UPI0023DBB2AB|nr:substrate-binding domain-containing protein [Neptuniibacter sp. CAU 1671]MDF2180627.1 substrate-binding domain-containing protein [Neptuniibacter sp. CAU 1671]